MVTHILILVFGVFMAATAAIFIKISTLDPYFLASGRLLLACVILSPFFYNDWKKHKDSYSRKHLRRCVIPGIIFATHFITWNIGVRETHAANGTLIVTLVPVVMPFVLFFTINEIVNQRELMGTMFSILGVCLLAYGDWHSSPEHLFGDLMCFISMLFYAYYLAAGRKNRDFPALWLYMVPLYFVAGVACFLAGLMSGELRVIYPAEQYFWLSCLALFPTVLGHSFINFGLKHLRGQVVGLINLLQFIFCGIFAYFFLEEVPTIYLYPASVLILIGAFIAIGSMPVRDIEKNADSPDAG